MRSISPASAAAVPAAIALDAPLDLPPALDEAAAAHEALEQGRTRGKIVLAVSEG